jgi:hypothetical protein
MKKFLGFVAGECCYSGSFGMKAIGGGQPEPVRPDFPGHF